MEITLETKNKDYILYCDYEYNPQELGSLEHAGCDEHVILLSAELDYSKDTSKSRNVYKYLSLGQIQEIEETILQQVTED